MTNIWSSSSEGKSIRSERHWLVDTMIELHRYSEIVGQPELASKLAEGIELALDCLSSSKPAIQKDWSNDEPHPNSVSNVVLFPPSGHTLSAAYYTRSTSSVVGGDD
jgi:hypothetical protein